MFVGVGPRGDCPSLERRRERRGAARDASGGSAGFVATLSGHGLVTDDASQI